MPAWNRPAVLAVLSAQDLQEYRRLANLKSALATQAVTGITLEQAAEFWNSWLGWWNAVQREYNLDPQLTLQCNWFTGEISEAAD